jgi:hypothetical protein
MTTAKTLPASSTDQKIAPTTTTRSKAIAAWGRILTAHKTKAKVVKRSSLAYFDHIIIQKSLL